MYLRLFITLVAFLVVAAIGWTAVTSAWLAMFNPWHSHTGLPWLDESMLALWVLASMLFVALGATFKSFVPSARPLLSAAVAGAVVGALIWLVEAPAYSDRAPMSAYVWGYGTYALAPLGMVLGSALRRRMVIR